MSHYAGLGRAYRGWRRSSRRRSSPSRSETGARYLCPDLRASCTVTGAKRHAQNPQLDSRIAALAGALAIPLPSRRGPMRIGTDVAAGAGMAVGARGWHGGRWACCWRGGVFIGLPGVTSGRRLTIHHPPSIIRRLPPTIRRRSNPPPPAEPVLSAEETLVFLAAMKKAGISANTAKSETESFWAMPLSSGGSSAAWLEDRLSGRTEKARGCGK